MPDCIHSLTPASSRHHSNHDERSISLPENMESQFDELMAAYSPRKGTTIFQAPASNGTSSAANSPSKRLRPSAAAEARAASCSHANARSVSMTTGDPPQPLRQTRDPSAMSMASSCSPPIGEQPVKAKPATEIRSRKEGRCNQDSQLRQKRAWGPPVKVEEKVEGKVVVANDGKRKRSSTMQRGNVQVENLISSSPVRKVSRVESKGEMNGDEGLMDEKVAGREPFGGTR